MDEKRSGFSLKAPGFSEGTVHLPGRDSFPRVDDHLVEPEVTTYEIIAGRRVALPADAPHGDRHIDLGTVVRIHMAPGYVASADLLTRHAVDSDFASDACVRREGIDPETGTRYLEEVVFEVVSTQTERKVTVKAEVMHRRGVRRIFGLWVKGDRKVAEWQAESRSWRRLDAESRIEDRCLATPLPVKALLDAALVRQAVVQALVSQGDPEILKLEEAAEARGKNRGEAQGMAKGVAQGVARSILRILEARGIPVSAAQREEILGCTDLERLDRWLLRAGGSTSTDEVTSAR